MSDKKQENPKRRISGWYALPFFVVLAVLTVASMILPLRPTVSYMEKRELAKFPEFSLEALVSGSYFDDISLWFSDTFPGREEWLDLANATASLRGYSRVSIQGQLSDAVEVPAIPEPTKPTPTEMPAAMETQETGQTDPMPEETVDDSWHGVDVGDEEILKTQTAIQIGDAVYSAQGFSQPLSDRYARALTHLSEELEKVDCQLVSAPAPTAIGILIEEEYLESLGSASQADMLAYLHGSMGDKILKADTVGELLKHNGEYVYFRTDHHWTALGAYYAYRAMCEAMGMEPVELDTMEEWDQGVFMGSMYGRAARPRQLRKDNCVAYIPNGEITYEAGNTDDYFWEIPILSDHSTQDENTKYLVFGTDYPITHAHNASLPDAPKCLVVKDSFGNPMTQFLCQNFSDVYAIDYRKFYSMNCKAFAEKHDIDYVIFMPYLTATQSQQGVDMFARLCEYYG